jgi:hypothetical protein
MNPPWWTLATKAGGLRARPIETLHTVGNPDPRPFKTHRHSFSLICYHATPLPCHNIGVDLR